VNEIAQKVRNQWYAIARREHVTEGDCETIRSAFENEGFSFQMQPAPKKKRKSVIGKTSRPARKSRQ
jgi:uncharacterized protein YcgL (UPF0745 family)